MSPLSGFSPLTATSTPRTATRWRGRWWTRASTTPPRGTTTSSATRGSRSAVRLYVTYNFYPNDLLSRAPAGPATTRCCGTTAGCRRTRWSSSPTTSATSTPGTVLRTVYCVLCTVYCVLCTALYCTALQVHQVGVLPRAHLLLAPGGGQGEEAPRPPHGEGEEVPGGRQGDPGGGGLQGQPYVLCLNCSHHPPPS